MKNKGQKYILKQNLKYIQKYFLEVIFKFLQYLKLNAVLLNIRDLCTWGIELTYPLTSSKMPEISLELLFTVSEVYVVLRNMQIFPALHSNSFDILQMMHASVYMLQISH